MKVLIINVSAVGVLLLSVGISWQVWMNPWNIQEDNVKQTQQLASDSSVRSVKQQPGNGSHAKMPQSLMTRLEPSWVEDKGNGGARNGSSAFTDEERIVDVKERLLAENEDAKQRQAAHIAVLEEELAAQSYDASWAPEFENQLISAFEESALTDHAAVTDVSCRSDSCIVDISSEQSVETGISAFQSETFEWLMANVSQCERFTVRQTALNKDTDEGASQRVFLQGCR